MWKVLSAISAVLLVGSGGLGYMNSQQLAEEQKLATRAKENLAAAEAHLKEAASVLDTKSGELEKATEDRDEAAEKYEVASTENAALDEQVTAKTDERDEKKETVDEYNIKLADIGKIEELKATVAQLRQQKAEADGAIARRSSVLASIEGQKASTEAVVQRYQDLELYQNGGILPENFSARVSSVNNNWGFVVLSAGNASSIVNKAKLDVKRGGSVIGQLVVTNVEQGRSVADIVKSSFSEGDAVRPGDLVVPNPDSTPSAASAASAATSASQPTTSTAAPAAAAAPEPAAPAPEPAAPSLDEADPFAEDMDAGGADDAPAPAGADDDPFADL